MMQETDESEVFPKEQEQSPTMGDALHDQEMFLLPDELLLLIFSYLLPSEWSVLAVVNKRFYVLSEDNSLWETVIPKEWRVQAATLLSTWKPSNRKRRFPTPTKIATPFETRLAKFSSDMALALPMFAQPELERRKELERLKEEAAKEARLCYLTDAIGQEEEGKGPAIISWKRAYYNWAIIEAAWHKKFSTTQPQWLSGDRPCWKPGTKRFPVSAISSSSNGYDRLINIVFVGTQQCGKSCFFNRLCYDKYSDEYQNTIGIEFAPIYTTLATSPPHTLKVHVWDTAGDMRFRSITRSYYRGAHAIFLCFDVTDKESFEALKTSFLPDVLSMASENVSLEIIGLKGDLPRVVTEEEIQELIGMSNQILPVWTLTSAKEGYGVMEAFSIAVAATERPASAFDANTMLLPSHLPSYLPGKRGWQYLFDSVDPDSLLPLPPNNNPAASTTASKCVIS